MLKTKSTLIFLLLFCVLTFVQAQKYISFAEAKDDITELQNKLINVHPAVETTQQKEWFAQQCEQLINVLPDQVEINKLYTQIATIIDAVPCGHTFVAPPEFDKIPKSIFFTVPLRYIEGKVIVVHEKNENAPKQLFELVSVENVPIDTILNQILQFQNGTDEELLESKKKVAVKRFVLAYHLFYKKKDAYQYQVKDINSGLIINKIANKSSEIERAKRTPFDYEYDEQNKTGILHLKSFMSYANDPLQMIYRTKLNKIFKEIEERKVEKLIIDVRGNGGGAASNMNLLLKQLLPNRFQSHEKVSGKESMKEYISVSNRLRLINKTEDDEIRLRRLEKELKPKKNRFDGELIVLTDEFTFSAASLFASLIKFNDRGILIGTSPGGNYNQTYGGFFEFYTLKNTEIRLRFPLFKVKLNVDEQLQKKGTNLLPDILVAQTIEDYLSNTDPVLERALYLLK